MIIIDEVIRKILERRATIPTPAVIGVKFFMPTELVLAVPNEPTPDRHY